MNLSVKQIALDVFLKARESDGNVCSSSLSLDEPLLHVTAAVYDTNDVQQVRLGK